MATKINWRSYGTKLRQCHPLYRRLQWCIGGVYAGIRRIPTSGVFWQRILTSVITNKQGTFRPFCHAPLRIPTSIFSNTPLGVWPQYIGLPKVTNRWTDAHTTHKLSLTVTTVGGNEIQVVVVLSESMFHPLVAMQLTVSTEPISIYGWSGYAISRRSTVTKLSSSAVSTSRRRSGCVEAIR